LIFGLEYIQLGFEFGGDWFKLG